MNEKLHSYKFKETTIKMPRHWVNKSELKKIAEEFGFQKSDNLDEVFKNTGVDTQGDSVDFNGVNFFLLQMHIGQVSGEFLNRIVTYNFDSEYVSVDILINTIRNLQVNIEESLVDPDEKEVIAVLKRLVN